MCMSFIISLMKIYIRPKTKQRKVVAKGQPN